MLANIPLFFTAAFFEILGSYSFWLYFRVEKGAYWIAIGVGSLMAFAYILTKIDLEYAGRVYAIYGGVYILSSLVWLVLVEKELFNKWDIIGSIVAFLGVMIIYFGNKNI